MVERDNCCDDPNRTGDIKLKTATKRFWVDRFGTPGMAINLWGVSPLYEFESLKEGSIPTVTPIDKVLEEGNCGEATNRGEETCECLMRKCHHLHSLQSCEVTNRNVIQGRCGQASGPTITKPFSNSHIGKSRACAVKVNRLILGRLEPKSGSRLYAQSRSLIAKAGGRFQLAAEAIVLSGQTAGRAEL